MPNDLAERTAITEAELAELMRTLEPAFDAVRIVEPSSAGARVLAGESAGGAPELGEPYCCFSALNRGHRCANCVSARTITSKKAESKLDFVNDDIYYVTTRYLEVEGRPCSLEMIKRVTDEAALFASGSDDLVSRITSYNNQTYYDSLTGAFNVKYFHESLGVLQGRQVAIVRVDNLAEIAETSGARMADAVVKTVTLELRAQVRKSDTIVRRNEAEFILQFNNMPSDVFDRRLAQIRAKLMGIKIAGAEDLVPEIVVAAVDKSGKIEDLAEEAAALIERARAEGGIYVEHDDTAVEEPYRMALADASQRFFDEDDLGIDDADRDPLTNLPSASTFRRRSQHIIDVSEGSGARIYFVHFDLENFKNYNRQYGYAEGDVLLRFVADTLRATFPDDLVCRVSVDHFDLMTSRHDLDARVAEVHDALARYNHRTPLELKCGIYQLDDFSITSGTATDRAKVACDSIKGTYDVSLRYFDADLGHELSESRFVVDNIDRALHDGHIKVFYQPVVRTLTGRICGFEALSRWQDPERGLLSPAVFIDTLERTHMIDKHDVYVLRRVCADIARLRAMGISVPVSVNLSRLDFQLCDIFAEVETAVAEAGIPKDALHLEVTESALDENPEFFRPMIERFRDAGYEVWMDDFGSGYSSLNLLKDYGFDVLKIDMAFLQGLEANNKSPQIISSIVDMGKKLGIRTLAEGVETTEQFDFLRQLGCELLQGYLFSKPLPFDEVIGLATGGVIECEDSAERAYYNTVGKVNMLSPIQLDAEDPVAAHLDVMSVDIPYAVVEKRGAWLHYLAVNDAYEEFLHSVGMESVAEQEERYLNASRDGRTLMLSTFAKATRTPGELQVDHLMKGRPVHSEIRHIAHCDSADAFILCSRAR